MSAMTSTGTSSSVKVFTSAPIRRFTIRVNKEHIRLMISVKLPKIEK